LNSFTNVSSMGDASPQNSALPCAGFSVTAPLEDWPAVPPAPPAVSRLLDDVSGVLGRRYRL